MAQAKTWAAFDVHVSGVVAAVLDRDSGELRVQRLAGRSEDVVAFAAQLVGPLRATYEAGPSGFVLARKLAAAGIECVVCAPGLIPRGPSDRVKTDRRDAERLVRLLAAGELHAVAVPGIEEEALRDLVRAREDLRGDLMPLHLIPDGGREFGRLTNEWALAPLRFAVWIGFGCMPT